MRRLLPGVSDDVDLTRAYELPAGHPHLRVNLVTGLDGSASVDGRSAGLSSTADKEVFFVLRGLADVVLVGAGTARAEGYGPVRRTASGRRPPIALVSARLALDLDSPLFRAAPPEQRPLVLTTARALAAAGRPPVEDVADVLVCGESDVDLATGLALLRSRGLAQVLCEGGPALFASLLDEGLVDELDLTLAPLLAGGPGIVGRPLTGAPLPARPLLLLEDAGWLFVRYSLRAGADGPTASSSGP